MWESLAPIQASCLPGYWVVELRGVEGRQERTGRFVKTRAEAQEIWSNTCSLHLATGCLLTSDSSVVGTKLADSIVLWELAWRLKESLSFGFSICSNVVLGTCHLLLGLKKPWNGLEEQTWHSSYVLCLWLERVHVGNGWQIYRVSKYFWLSPSRRGL